MTLGALVTYCWQDASDAPLIHHSRLSPLIADPAVVAPEQAPDGTWHLFAHSAWGIHHYRSADGLSWNDHGIVVRRGMRPWIFSDGGAWRLVYERFRAAALALTALPGRPWWSCIELRSSTDLRHWGPARTLLEPSLPRHRSAGLGEALGCPCIVKGDGRYHLYYSAGLVRVPDCGFNEPRCIGLAFADRVEGPYAPAPEPILEPDAGNAGANLSRGAFRVLRLEDGWAGFENGISFHSGMSASALLLLRSVDGIRWEPAASRPVVAPAPGWKRSHVYAGCPVPRVNGELYLYYNARNDWPLARGRENIGLAIGRPAGKEPAAVARGPVEASS